MGIIRKRKQERGLKALASGSLAFARAHAVLDKTEKELEAAIQKENRKPPESCIGKTRFKGQKLLHSKHVLLCIVFMNILDCILVLGELILDIYYLKGLLESEHAATYGFVTDMRTKYPTELGYLDEKDIDILRTKILKSHVDFSGHHIEATTPHEFSSFPSSTLNDVTSSFPSSTSTTTDDMYNGTTSFHTQNDTDSSTHSIGKRDVKSNTHHRMKRAANSNLMTNSSPNSTDDHHDVHHHHNAHSIEEKVAHIFHYCSVSILGILVIETAMKIFCSGKEYFENKLEVFDGFIVVVSFTVDLVFIKGLSAYEIQQFVVILAFLVPWRVIRVVNSLVVAVIDHEHFRMKLLYKQKKEVVNELKSVKSENKSLQTTLDHVKNMAIKGGVSEKAISGLIALHLQNSKTKSKKSINGFASSIISKASSGFSFKQRHSSSSYDSGNFSSVDNISDEKIMEEQASKDDVFVNVSKDDDNKF